LTESPRSREHITSVYLSVPHYLGVNRLSASLEIGKHAALLLALNQGLHKLGMISDEDYEPLDRRYRRKLKDIIAQSQLKPESHHVPVVSLEKQKEQLLLDRKNLQFLGMLGQWDLHKDPEWRRSAAENADKYLDKLESARALKTQYESETKKTKNRPFEKNRP